MKQKQSYKNLSSYKKYFDGIRLEKLFEENPERADLFSINTENLYLDYSKNHINDESLKLLIDFAEEQNLKKKIEDLFSGKVVNRSENRPALHTSLRTQYDEKILINSNDTLEKIHNTQQAMFSFSKKLTAGEIKGCSGKVIKHFIVLGIGGSYLGPKFVIDALKPFHQNNISITFIANIDQSVLQQSLKNLKLDECIFFIASKSFSTLETLENAKAILQRLIDEGHNEHLIKNHFFAATSNTQAAREFGIQEENIFPLWDWIGGRFSLWSSIGLPVLLAIGEQNYKSFFQGAFEMDEHFQKSAPEKNMPVILALLSFWYQQFFSASSQVVIPYAHNLKTFPAFLQQLDMESLGKSVTENGEALDYPSGSIIWGSEGTNSQHSFHQLLHQGTHFIPVDFIVSATPDYPDNKNHHLLYGQCLAQSRALMTGNDSLGGERQCKGNKPSNTLVLKGITPGSIGALIALYEHKIFVQSVLLNINAFDQWGVELGKTIGKEITLAIQHQKINGFDASTNKLLSFLK